MKFRNTDVVLLFLSSVIRYIKLVGIAEVFRAEVHGINPAISLDPFA